jgi:sphingolipid C9-methyltransferase
LRISGVGSRQPHTDVFQYPTIANAPLPADGPGSDAFNNKIMLGAVTIVPYYMAWKIGGGLKTAIFFAIFTTIPILMAYWTLASSYSPRKNEKAKLPGKSIEHYLTFHNDEDRAKYRGRRTIPMHTFSEMFFDGKVEVNGDMLEVLELRHDWANFQFTWGLFYYFLMGFIPELIMHTRSQGTSPAVLLHHLMVQSQS